MFCSCTLTHVALQLVRLLGMLDVELLGVAGVVVELAPVSEVTSLSLTLSGLQELGLVCMDLVVGALLLGLTRVLQVALEFAGCQRVHHLGVVLDTAQPHLLALVPQMGLLVTELSERKDRLKLPAFTSKDLPSDWLNTLHRTKNTELELSEGRLRISFSNLVGPVS